MDPHGNFFGGCTLHNCTHGKLGARAYNWGLGAEPQRQSRWSGVRGRDKPPEAEIFEAFACLQDAVLLDSNVHRGWLGSRVVGVLDSGAERPGFKSQPRRCP